MRNIDKNYKPDKPKIRKIRYSEDLSAIADLSKVFAWIGDLPPTKLVLQDRLSCSKRDNPNTLTDRTPLLISKVEEYGHTVVKVFGQVDVKGWYPELMETVDFCLQNNLPLVWLTVDRAIRSEKDMGTKITHVLRVRDIKRLLFDTKGVKLVIIARLENVERSHQNHPFLVQLANKIRDSKEHNKGGRPWNWERCKAKALELRKVGFGQKRVAQMVSKESRRTIKKEQVQKWEKRTKKG